MKRILLTCTVLLATVWAVAAQSQTITFEPGGLVDSGTFLISSPGPNSIEDFGVFPTTTFGWCAEDCSGLNVVTLARADNAPFSLSSVDIAALSDVGNGNPMVVTGNLSGGGVVVRNLALPLVADSLETRAVTGFDSVVSVTFTKRDTFVPDLADAAIDNLVVGSATMPAGPAVGVPVMPWPMLVLTILGAVFVGRRSLLARR